jgi:hypothetical protein
MPAHSRSKNGVASLAYVAGICFFGASIKAKDMGVFAALYTSYIKSPRSPVAARQHLDQFADLAPLFGLVAGRNGVLDAMGGVIGEDFLLGAA